MTGDQDCSVVEISQLEKSLSSHTGLSAAQPVTTAFITSNMTVSDHCIYTTAIPSELAENFPEGTVLQIMPDSSILALSVKNLPLSNENSIIYKDSPALADNTQNGLNLSNLLTEPSDQQNVDNAVCSVENISDIDLSFLNDTEENNTIANSKCLNDNSVKELQGIIADVTPQSLNLLQNDLHLTDNNAKECPEPEQVDSEPTQQPNESNNVVMIDVSKPIQLSQNSLIMVNGQKCVLQHDSQSGQVIAYPVKEQEKPRKKRGRPRKTLVEQPGTEAMQNENEGVPSREAESLSDEEREKGLLEVVNDDGALVRRSSRKRKKAKVLKDYETGNLKQELGSDLEDMDVVDKDTQICSNKKKSRGPGRPRKYNKALETILDSNTNNGTKRPRGRPRKIVPESEPTQAFLVQTADGQILMMQVPLSSIPPGISLQEMAQEIANKLNLGLNTGTSSKELACKSDEQIDVNPSEGVEIVSEPALQDHSVGSTTNFPSIPPELNSANENSNIVDSTCQDIINDMNQIIGNHIATSGEIMLESNNSAENSNVAESFPKDKNQISVLEVPQCTEDNFCFNIASTTTPNDSSSILCNLADALTDHDFFQLKPNIPNPNKEISGPIQANKTCEVPKDFLNKCDVLKDKIDFPVALQTDTLIGPESQSINIEELLNKNLNSDSPEGFILNVDKLKSYNMAYDSVLSDNKSISVEKQYIIQEMPNIDCPDPISRNVVNSVDIEAKADVNSAYLQNESVIENVQCTDVITGEYLNTTDCGEVKSLGETTVLFLKSDEPQAGSENFEVVLPLHQTALSLESSAQNSNVEVNNSSSTTVIPVPERVLPMLVPSQPADGPKNCKICQRSCSTHEELIKHFKVNHPRCICTECNYMNEHPYVIRRHAFRHTNHGCVCKICNKKYKDLYILKMHIKMVHLPPDVLYACEICEKKFTRKAHLKRHLRIHAPVKQYQCPHCDYKGCEKSDITKHLLIHEEPRYNCEICGKAFRHVKNKELHVKRHSGQRDYKCAACGFFGYTYTDIRKHIERRHSVSCPECRQVFTDIELLKEHKSKGSCQANPLKEDHEIKIEEGPSIIIDDKDQDLLDGMPLDILETDQPQVMTISECTEETLSALQNGELIMTSVDGILNPANGQLVVEDTIISSDVLSVVAVERDSTKTITFVTPDGKNVSIPLKDCRTVEALECATTASETNITESFLLTNEPETAS